jgi:hypothetical protein
VWEWLLAELNAKRVGTALNKSLLDPNALATVYAGALTDDSLDRLREKHMLNFVMDGAYHEASNHRDGSCTSRTHAHHCSRGLQFLGSGASREHRTVILP